MCRKNTDNLNPVRLAQILLCLEGKLFFNFSAMECRILDVRFAAFHCNTVKYPKNRTLKNGCLKNGFVQNLDF